MNGTQPVHNTMNFPFDLASVEKLKSPKVLLQEDTDKELMLVEIGRSVKFCRKQFNN